MKKIFIANTKSHPKPEVLVAKLYPYREVIHSSMQNDEELFQKLIANNDEFKNLVNPMANQFRGLLNRMPSNRAGNQLLEECKSAFSTLYYFGDSQALLTLLTKNASLVNYYNDNLTSLAKIQSIYSIQRGIENSKDAEIFCSEEDLDKMSNLESDYFLAPVEDIKKDLQELRIDCIGSPSPKLNKQNQGAGKLCCLYETTKQKAKSQPSSVESSQKKINRYGYLQ